MEVATDSTTAQNESAEPRSLFFVTSGEHKTLPNAEIRAILESTQINYNCREESYRLLSVQAPSTALEAISKRSLMYDRCGFELERCRADENEILRLVRGLPLDEICRDASCFAVRVARLGGVNKRLARSRLEREVGAVIKQQVPRLAVKLNEPELEFQCVLYEDSFLFGISAFKKPSGLIAPRRPRKRPVFHPATMPPKIARCMVNMSRARPHGTFADPFSGVGGIAIEAAMIGCEVAVIDASLRMVRGTLRNLRHFQLNALGCILGDARRIPLHGLDAIATDPPYGRDSSTRGVEVDRLYDDFLSGAEASLDRNAHICISAPAEVDVVSFAENAGLKVREKHLVRIHRSLTRQFVVIQDR